MKTAPEIRLTAADRATLRGLLRRGTGPARVQTRARALLLASDASVGSRGGARRRANSNETIGATLLISPRTVARIRQRFVAAGLSAALYDRLRSGRPVAITGSVEAQLVTLACSAPPAGHARWTLQLLADRVVELGYAARLSKATVHARLKKTACAPGRSRVGVSRR